MKDFKDISRFFTIARTNDMQIEFNKNKCRGFQIISDIDGEDIELSSKDILGIESSEQITIREFKDFLNLLDLDENMPIKLTFYHRGGKVSEEGELQSIGIDKDGCLCLSTIR